MKKENNKFSTDFLLDLVISIIFVIRNFFLLLFFPYRTMRKLSLTVDLSQALIIFLATFFYFKFAYFLKDKPFPATLTFLVFLVNFFITVGFFYFLTKILFKKKSDFKNLFFTFSYTLLPTLIWFGTTSILYLILPPPRTTSLLGKGFSIFFVAFSLSLLVWKMILVFLSLRFSLKLNFYQIIYLWFMYFVWFLPYAFFLYYLRLFRVPFI